jgi:hypothetical protein
MKITRNKSGIRANEMTTGEPFLTGNGASAKQLVAVNDDLEGETSGATEADRASFAKVWIRYLAAELIATPITGP